METLGKINSRLNLGNLKYKLFYPSIALFSFLIIKINPPLEWLLGAIGLILVISTLTEKNRIQIAKRRFTGWPEIGTNEYRSPFWRIFYDISGKGEPTIIQSPPPQPLATEKFNEALLPFQVEQAKAFQPIILEQLIPLFKESGVPALREQADQLAKTFLPLINQIGETAGKRLIETSAPGFTGISKETSDLMFQRAQERIAPQFRIARERVGERAASRGTLRSGTTSKSLMDIDIAEADARRISAIDQAIFEYQQTETQRQTATREAQTAGGFAPTPFALPSPQFQSGGFINPTPPQVIGGQGPGGALVGAGALAKGIGTALGSAATGASAATGIIALL